MKKEAILKEVRQRVLDNKHLTAAQKEDVLKRMEAGQEYGFNSGYATIDRAWLEFLKTDKLYDIENTKTIYQDILDNNKDYLDTSALLYFGANISYGELFKRIDSAAKSLEEYGVKAGDYVTVCCAGIPEAIYTVYGLAKIGAIANLMAPYFDKDQMTERINDCESNTLIVMDKFYPVIKDAIKKSNIKKVIVIPTLNSSILRFLPNKDKISLNYVNELWWNQFIKDGKKRDVPETFAYEKDYPLCMVYSSGTTGASKAIVLSHDSFQYSVLSYDANTIDIIRGEKMYQIVPPWYSTGLSTSIHLPLHNGVTIFQDPRFERDIFVNNIVKQNINYAIGPTSMYEGFLDEKLIKGKKLTKFYNPVQGGEPLNQDLKEKIETSIKNMGVDTKIIVAYGQCECGAQATSQSKRINHPANSVGIPIPGVTVTIVDDNFEELTYGNRGNIVVNTPCGMLGYFKRPDATNAYFHYDKYGKKWNCTGDIGYMGPNGDLFVEGRASDYTMVGDKKVYNFDIESEVRGLEDIKNCDCIGRPNEVGGRDIALHLIFTDKYAHIYQENIELFESRIAEIQKLIYEKYKDIDYVPTYFKIREDFPYKPSGKRDIEELAGETEGFIKFDKEFLLDTSKQKKRK